MRDDQTRHDWEDRLRTGLRDLEAGPPGGGGLPGPDQVRRTHLRRRTALSGVAALATVVVAGGAVLALDRPSTSAPIAPTTTSEPAPTGTAAPEPSATSPTADPPVTSTAPAVVVPTTIPDGFLLPHEGEAAPANSDVTAWTEVERPELRACESAPDPRLEPDPTDSRTVEQTGPEYQFSVGLHVFESAEVAAGWVAAHRDVADGCLDVASSTGRVVTVSEDLPGAWGQGFVWAESYRTIEDAGFGEFSPGGAYTLMVRVGSAVAVTTAYGEFGAPVEVDPGILGAAREPLDELAPRLCVFTEAGC